MVTTLALSGSVMALPCQGQQGEFFINQSGEKGGFVAHTALVEKSVYLGKHTQICDNAEIRDFAQITGNAIISENAKVYDTAKVFGDARVFGNAEVFNRANIWGHAQAFGDSQIFGIAGLKDNVKVFGKGKMYDATYGGNAIYF
jgi:UDP-3-O-[3-hydroxymyristoyl] glucosamine N-acyltransferase